MTIEVGNHRGASVTRPGTTLDAESNAPTRSWRFRISLGQTMALVAASAAVSALYLELARPQPVGASSRFSMGFGPGIMSALLVISGASVGALRRSSATETIAGVGLTAAALAFYGSLRGTLLSPLWLPVFLAATIAFPLWARRLQEQASLSLRAGSQWVFRAARLGLNVGLTVLAIAVAILPADMIEMILPSTSTPMMIGMALPSPSTAIGPPQFALPPVLAPPVFSAPPPPDVDSPSATGSEYRVGIHEGTGPHPEP